MSYDFDVTDYAIKVSGDTNLPHGTEYDHDEEIHVVARVRVSEVAFPEITEKGEVVGIARVHKTKILSAVAVDAESAEKLLAVGKGKRTGQYPLGVDPETGEVA